MTSHSFKHSNAIPGKNYIGRPILPMASGETRAVCFGCPGEHGDKMSAGCANCKRRKMGKADCVDPLNYNYVEPEYINKKNELHPCKWRGCINKTRSRYCQRHGMVAYQREKQWRTNHPGKPVDENWLFRPIRKKVAKL